MTEKQYLKKTPILLFFGILAVFTVRTVLAAHADVPRLFDWFDLLTVAGSLFVVLKDPRRLHTRDWLAGLLLGGLVGTEMMFTTLFSPYPTFGIVRSTVGQAWARGIFTASAALGGLTIMRQGGPVQFYLANGNWRKAGRGTWAGLAVGLPLAILNAFALQFTQGQAIEWQNPLAAMLDALQPGIVEEVVYRFALWGLLWLVLRTSQPEWAVWSSGLLAMLVHNYAHFDELFLQSPLAALGMGAVLALLWGLPPLILARRKGLESAMAFHWIQDVTRFMTGF